PLFNAAGVAIAVAFAAAPPDSGSGPTSPLQISPIRAGRATLSQKTQTMSDADGWVDVPARGRESRKRDHPSRDGDDEGGDEVVYSPPQPSPRSDDETPRPFVLILCGIPGTGKSHFASRLAEALPRKFVRVNQDALGTRRKCEAMSRRALSEGKIPVIDRCNFDLDQRRTWIGIAEEAGAHCDCIVFRYDEDVCVTRCQKRRGHETMHPSKARGVVSLLARKFRPPVVRTRNSIIVRCSGGENFRRLSRVTSFEMANELAESYLQSE
ncbi:hypothetical protein ACHAWF_007204, partial [Thalassiosira exigua]